MINVSTAFRNQLAAGNRRYVLTADITLKNNTTLSITNADIWQDSFRITDSVSTDDNFDVGAAIINSASLTLNNIYPLTASAGKFSAYDFTDARVVLYVGLNTGSSTERVRKGTYTVDEARYNGSLIELSVLDYMAKFDKPYSESTLTYPATLGAIVRDACTRCGVTLNTGTFPHYTHVVQTKPDSDTLTYREIISYAAQIAGCFARCDAYGRLELKWFPAFGTSTPALPSTYSHDLGVDSVTITGVTVRHTVTDTNGDETTVTDTAGGAGYMITIEDNPLIQDDYGDDIAAWLGSQLIGLTFRRGEMSHLSDPTIEAGDVAKLTDIRGNTYNVLVSSTTFTAGGAQTTLSSAQTPLRNSSQRYGAMAKTYAALKKRIEAEKTARELALETFGQRLAESPGFYTTTETPQGGGTIFYMHDKPDLEDSTYVWKMTAEAWGVSTDGGQTWNGGMTVDGDTIVRLLSVEGVDAGWITTGELVVSKNNQEVLYVNCDTGVVRIIADSFSLSNGDTIDSIASDAADTALGTLTQQEIFDRLTNNGAAQGITLQNGQLYISFSVAQGGTLTLGGANNASGVLQLKDSSGNVKATMDNTGLTSSGSYSNRATKSVLDSGKLVFYINNNKTLEIGPYGSIGSGDFQTALFTNGKLLFAPDVGVSSSSFTFQGDILVTGNITVNGTKSRAVSTDNYADRLLYAYETPSPYFGDLGSAQLDEYGECIVDIDDIFSETVRTDLEYHVFLQKEGHGDLWIADKQRSYFIVQGTPGLRFSWELKAKQAGYEADRLEVKEGEA